MLSYILLDDNEISLRSKKKNKTKGCLLTNSRIQNNDCSENYINAIKKVKVRVSNEKVYRVNYCANN